MNVGELFINLGVKGADKSIGAIAGVNKGLKETSTTAWETKAAIVGAMYALERLFSAAGQRGTDLTNLSKLLGMSTKTLQQYEYAARQVGVSNEEMDGTFKTLQSTMEKVVMGTAQPSGMGLIAQLTGGISDKELPEFAAHPEKMLQKLQQAAQEAQKKGIPDALLNEAMRSFGLGDSMISALRRNAFRPEVLAKAPTLNDKEVAGNDKANIGWSNLRSKLEMGFEKFNAVHGEKLVSDISKVADEVLKLVNAFTKLADQIKLFDLISTAFEGWTEILQTVSELVDTITGAMKSDKKMGQLKEDATNVLKYSADSAGEIVSGGYKKTLDFVKSHLSPSQSEDQNKDSVVPSVSPVNAASPKVPPVNRTENTSKQQNINVNQTLNFQHPGTNAQQVAESHKKAYKDALRINPALAGGY